MSIGVLDQVLDQGDYWWQSMFRPRLDGLSDHEYLWEPVPGCLSLRPDDTGHMRLETAWPEPFPPPFTTIAWRISHLNPMIRASRHFGDGSMTIETIQWPNTADGAFTFLEQGWTMWRDGVASLGDKGLFGRKVGPSEGPYAEHPFISLVLHMNRELIHHSAEVSTLRDLYWHTHRSDPDLQALLAGTPVDDSSAETWRSRFPDLIVAAIPIGGLEAVRRLVDLGFDVNAGYRRKPIHQAIEADDLQLVRFLVAAGADVTAKDSLYEADAAGWAAFFKREAIAAYLESLT